MKNEGEGGDKRKMVWCGVVLYFMEYGNQKFNKVINKIWGGLLILTSWFEVLEYNITFYR